MIQDVTPSVMTPSVTPSVHSLLPHRAFDRPQFYRCRVLGIAKAAVDQGEYPGDDEYDSGGLEHIHMAVLLGGSGAVPEDDIASAKAANVCSPTYTSGTLISRQAA